MITTQRTQIHNKSDFISFTTYGHLPHNYIWFFPFHSQHNKPKTYTVVLITLFFLQECCKKTFLLRKFSWAKEFNIQTTTIKWTLYQKYMMLFYMKLNWYPTDILTYLATILKLWNWYFFPPKLSFLWLLINLKKTAKILKNKLSNFLSGMFY